MKLLFFATDYRPLLGGIATYTEELALNLSKTDEVVMLVPWGKKAHLWDIKNPFKTIRVINIWALREFIFSIYLVYYIVSRRFKKVLCQVWFPCGLIAYFLSFLIRFDYYSVAFGSDYLDDTTTLKRRIKYRFFPLKIRTFNASKRVFAISNYSARKLVEMGVNKENIEIVTPGVDVKKFRAGNPSKQFITKYNLKNKRIILTVARLDIHKGHDLVIKVFPRVLEKFPDVYYYIIGDGPERTYLENLVLERNLKERVIFVGYVSEEEMIEFYQTCEIFVMPSREIRADLVEGFGITLVEAAACEKVVIGGHSGGVSSAVSDGISGVLIDPQSEEELLLALDKFLSNREINKQFGIQARKWVEKERTWEVSASKIKKLMLSEPKIN